LSRGHVDSWVSNFPSVADALRNHPSPCYSGHSRLGALKFGALWQKESPRETGAFTKYLVVKLLQ